jgi:integrase
MARRSGQSGYIEQKGNFYWVRFWKDQRGQSTRAHCCVRICPVTGVGALNKPQREHRAREIIQESGADTAEHFQQTVIANLGTTFRQQTEWWIDNVQNRKRRPVKERTAKTWKSHLQWLLPRIGDTPLSEVNNLVLRDLVEQMSEAGFTPKTILNYAFVVKAVVASAVDKDGEPLYPRKWDHEFADLREIGEQRTPAFTAEEIERIIARADARYAVLYSVLAASGLRIGEALALQVPDFQDGTLSIRQSIWNGRTTSPKTRFAVREVDLPTPIREMLAAFIGHRKDRFLFPSRTGSALGQRNVLRDSLHPILKNMGWDAKKGLAGFHAFRRFRVTHLRKQKTSEDLLRFWIGHGDKTVTDRYQKLAEDQNFRKTVAEEVGTGFKVSAMLYPLYPSSVGLDAVRMLN